MLIGAAKVTATRPVLVVLVNANHIASVNANHIASACQIHADTDAGLLD